MINDEQIAELIANYEAPAHIWKDDVVFSREYAFEFARELIALAQQVKPMEWVLQDRFYHAVRQNYKVSAEPTRIGYSVYYRGGLLGRAMSVTDAKQLAQDDLKKRVLGNLVHGGGE